MRVKTNAFAYITKLEEELKLYDIDLVDDGAYEILYIHSPLLANVEDVRAAYRKEIPIIYAVDTDYDYEAQTWLCSIAEVLIYRSTEELTALKDRFGNGIVIAENEMQAQKLSALFKLTGAGTSEAE